MVGCLLKCELGVVLVRLLHVFFMSFWRNCNLGTSNATAEYVRIHTALAPD